ncbi:MAG: chromosomal replication initiator protein DnaA [Gemmatimonadetes bacterium]|nr:chromosomal replication initiator protein DnaA [Gemmatimonadota bacterium]
MPLSPKDVWKRILDEARRELTEQAVETWLSPAEPLSFDGANLVLGLPDEFAVKWNEAKHSAILAKIAEVVLGHAVGVSFRVPDDRRQRPQIDFFVAPPPEPITAPIRTTQSPLPLNERYTFDSFVIGKSNELAAAAAYAVAEAPGRTYNPLFIYGGTGLGKTHLMQAIAHAVIRKNPATRVTYIGAEHFINEVIEGIHGRTMPDLRRRYRSEIDLFLVDDVHFLEGKEATQEEFFHTFNTLYESQKQIVLTSDRAPKEMPGLEDRLVSRFGWGMVADVGMPDLEHRIAILRKKQEQDHLETTIPDDVLTFIAEHVYSNVRELEGSIIKLLLYASLRHREISVDLAREALADRIRPSQTTSDDRPKALPSIDKVQDVVARRWGVTPEGLRSKARIKSLTVPRQIAMYLAREVLNMQLVEIGQAFGGRDHSTVIHSVGKVQRELARDRGFRDRVDSARVELTSSVV